MKLVIIESPYAGDIEGNTLYARQCMHDSLKRGEAPIASHLLYTQSGILEDNDPPQRALGIKAGLAWRRVAELSIFYTDRGWSSGMKGALTSAIKESRPYLLRALYGVVQFPDAHSDIYHAAIMSRVDQEPLP
jgi:hypothetical protein